VTLLDTFRTGPMILFVQKVYHSLSNGTTMRAGENIHNKVEPTKLGGELGYDFDHLVDIDKLDPCLQVFRVVVPYERRLSRPAKERARALVLFLDENVFPRDAEIGLEHAELPSCQRMTIALGSLFGDVELETGPVEADRLTYGFYIGLLEREDDT